MVFLLAFLSEEHSILVNSGKKSKILSGVRPQACALDAYHIIGDRLPRSLCKWESSTCYHSACMEFEAFSSLTFSRCQLLFVTFQNFKGDLLTGFGVISLMLLSDPPLNSNVVLLSQLLSCAFLILFLIAKEDNTFHIFF